MHDILIYKNNFQNSGKKLNFCTTEKINIPKREKVSTDEKKRTNLHPRNAGRNEAVERIGGQATNFVIRIHPPSPN
jgi:hypothetical protein